MSWNRGYTTSSGYAFGVHSETAPSRLHWIASLGSVRAPTRKFRYLDLGFGQGLSLLSMAAMHPDAEFIGIDFMPQHVSHARAMAEAAGITNVSFVEGDFLELAQSAGDFGAFDYVVAHGITTWVAPEVRKALFKLTRDVLVPGGIMYNSYNTLPGWLSTSPFQNLVLEIQEKVGVDAAIPAAIDWIEKIKGAQSPLFNAYPNMASQVEGLSSRDPNYLAHEYSNLHWAPQYSRSMIGLANEFKLDFLSSATLLEVFDANYTDQVIKLLNTNSNAIEKETIRDYCLNQSFRRDIYVKGRVKRWGGEAIRQLKSVHFRRTLRALPDPKENFDFQGLGFHLRGNYDQYSAILDALGDEGLSVGQLIERFPESDISTMARMLSLLIHSNWAGFVGTSDHGPSQQLNRTILQAILDGAPYQHLCAPAYLAPVAVDEQSAVLMALMANNIEKENLPNELIHLMKQRGKAFKKDGIEIKNPAEVSTVAKEVVDNFLVNNYPNFQKAGVIDF